MKVVRSTRAMYAMSQSLRIGGGVLGFVPTMGYLHEGHVSLVQLSRKHAARTVVSIFVNPTQFAPGEDFAQYPRDEERDLALCEAAGVDVVFLPGVDDLYAPDASVHVVEGSLSRTMCGQSRPMHFEGVCTVVAKLFHLVQPDVAVFGQKDAQQLAVIRRMVRDLCFPVEILAGPIMREPDGLAMSSRNVYLSDAERKSALGLSRTLGMILDCWQTGEHEAIVLEQQARAHLARVYPAVQLEYLVFCDPDTLWPCDPVPAGALVALAARVGSTRLIDNILI
jgi:pantoate--beta-alanine ligase